jgi:hypothetical protein
VLTGHTQDVKSVVFHPDKELAVSCSYDDTLKVARLSLRTRHRLATICAHLLATAVARSGLRMTRTGTAATR